jgi:Txe/YoeB family toxin of Txe-Axe toxin-antitoxin module
MSVKRWMDNAFWETDEKKQLNCILELIDDGGREQRQVMLLNRHDKDGTENELFNEVIEARGEEEIDKNTEERKTRKAAEAEEKKQRDVEHARARKLEDLFNYKLEVFETEEIKESKNRKMKAKIRRAKSKIEVNLYAMMLLQEELEEKENVESE